MKRFKNLLWILCAATITLQAAVPGALAADDAQAYLAAAAEALGEYYRPAPVYGRDTNICDLLEGDLADQGYPGIEAAVQEVDIRQDGGNIAPNGDITYFFADPDSYRGYWGATAFVTFTLNYQDAQMDYKPGRTVNIPWDEARVKAYMLENSADYITFDAICGDNTDPSAITENIMLPQYCGNNRNVRVSWSSDNETAISIQPPVGSIDEIMYGNYTGFVQPGKKAQSVELTALFTFNKANAITLTKTFSLTVPPVSGEAEEAEMQAILDNYTTECIRDFFTGQSIGNGSRVTGDLRLPTPSELGIYDRKFDVLLSIENTEDIAYINVPDLKNAGRVYIFRPLPEEGDKNVSFTITLQSRQNPNITVQKQFRITVLALDAAELDAAAEDMQTVKANFFTYICGENTEQANVTKNLKSFYGIYKENGALTARSYQERGTGGILAAVINPEQAVPDYRRYFASSHPLVVAEESLLVTRPQKDTQVTVSACLTDERFGAYLEIDNEFFKYAYDYTVKYSASPQLAALYRQPVSAVLTVRAAPAEADVFVTVMQEDGIPVVDGQLMAQTAVHIDDTDHDGMLSVHDVLTAFHKNYCESGYAVDEKGDIIRLWGMEKADFVLYQNHQLVHTAKQAILDGDYLEAYIFTTQKENSRYLHFREDRLCTLRGEPLRLILEDGQNNPVSHAEIGIFDANGMFVPMESISTNEAGETDLSWPIAGTVYLSARKDGNIAAVCRLQTVDTLLPAETMTVTPSVAELKPGEQLKLTAEFYPAETTNQIVTWKSSDGNVAVVNPNGIITAVGAGSAVITASGSEVSASCLITVERDGNGGGGGESDTFSASFTLNAGDAVWISETTVSGLQKGDTVFDVFKKVLKERGFRYTAEGGYISAVTNAKGVTLANFDHGAKSGWMYTVDGVLSPVHMGAHKLTGGEEIIFFYAGDYTEVAGGSGGSLPSGNQQTQNPQDTEKDKPADEKKQLPFLDVEQSAWYYPAVQAVYEKGLFSGMTETEFFPDAGMSRAMLVMVLYRLAGMPAVSGQMPFADVDLDSWYGKAVLWAVQAGIVSGISETMFAPDAQVTREQIAVMLYHYAELNNADMTVLGDIDGFIDAGRVSAWAVAAVQWATEKTLLRGRENGILDPLGNATRAEVAQMMYSYYFFN